MKHRAAVDSDVVRSRFWAVVLAVLALAAMSACGGGGGGGGGGGTPPPPAQADFQLDASPNSLTLTAGSSLSVSVSATALHGFAGQVSVSSSGAPSSVTLSPSSFTLTPGTPQQVTFTTAASASAASATVTFTGTSGTLSHTTQVSVSIQAAPTNTPTFRTRFFRTDADTAYFTWLNSHWAVFDAPSSRFFVTDPETNRIHVLDATTESEVGTIVVPGAFGIDETADNQTIWVGTLIGDVYAIDPVSMAVKKRYIASQIGPYGFRAFTALAVTGGRVALLGAQGGIPSVDGSPGFAIWNPTDNSITIYGTSYGMGQLTGVPATQVCGGMMGNIGAFTRTPDRSKIVTGSVFSDNTICVVDVDTGVDNYFATAGSSTKFVISPDGKYLVTPFYYGNAIIYDMASLSQIAQFAVAGDTSSASGFTFGTDPNILLVPSDTIVYAYNLTSRQQVGWLPNIFVPFQVSGGGVGPTDSPYYSAVTAGGLLAGPLTEGVGFLDLSTMHTGAVGTQHTNGYLNPATGPASGGTQTQWTGTTGTLKDVYFGPRKATGASVSSTGIITATSPSGAPGPADVYVFTTDGGMQLIPDAFSYGPTILQVTTNASTTEGGGTGTIYGYGFGGVAFNSPLPSDLQISVGGQSAPATAFSPNAYGTLSPPFPMQSVSFTLPSASVGPVDVTVSTTSGSATAKNAITYLPGVQSFGMKSSSLVQGIYDPYRDLYYFTDATQIQVFSRTQGGWLTPLPIPNAARPWGLALSPDGSKLAVADMNANTIDVMDMASQAWTTYPLPVPYSGITTGPVSVAISNSGFVYYTTYNYGGTGFHNFYKLDTSTGTVTDYGISGPGTGYSEQYLRTAISSDNSRVYFNNDGYVFAIDTATDKVFSATADAGCCYGNYDLSLSSNQTSFAASGYFYDSDLNAESFQVFNAREVPNFSYVYGMKLSPDGTLLFQPAENAIDVFDARLGILRQRILLPDSLSPNFDALVADGKDNVLIGITGSGTGIAIIDLTSVTEPPPLPYSTVAAKTGSPSKTALPKQPVPRQTMRNSRPLESHRQVPYKTVSRPPQR